MSAPRCTDCAHRYVAGCHRDITWSVDPLSGERAPSGLGYWTTAERGRGECGPTGRYWTPRAEKTTESR